MTLLHLLADGALAAAQMLAFLFVTPAAAAEPLGLDEPAGLERPIQLHRLSTTLDVRLLGSLADVRVAQHLRNDGSTTADLGSRLPAVDEDVDSLRVIRSGHAVELLASGDCGDEPVTDHARLSNDEAIADALRLAPGAEAVIAVTTAQALVPTGGTFRIALPTTVDAEEPRAQLIDQGDAWFLLVVPHRRASSATLVLRPTSGDAETLQFGRVDPRLALLIPLRSRAQLDDLAEGAIEVELNDADATYWTTVAADRVNLHDAAQARVTE